MSNKTMILELERAILSIINGAQEYQVGTRRVKKADLDKLITYKNALVQQEAAGDEGGFANTYASYFEGR